MTSYKDSHFKSIFQIILDQNIGIRVFFCFCFWLGGGGCWLLFKKQIWKADLNRILFFFFAWKTSCTPIKQRLNILALTTNLQASKRQLAWYLLTTVSVRNSRQDLKMSLLIIPQDSSAHCFLWDSSPCNKVGGVYTMSNFVGLHYYTYTVHL